MFWFWVLSWVFTKILRGEWAGDAGSLASYWSRLITWPGNWPLIGWQSHRGRNAGPLAHCLQIQSRSIKSIAFIQLNTQRWAADCTCHDCISRDVTPASWHVWCEDTCHACHKDAEVFLWSYGSNVTPAPVHFSLNILIQGGSFRFWEFSWFLFKLKHKYMSMYILKRMLPWYAKLII